ncbi:MAG: histidinol-phosphatase HisJ family protein [Peptococcaceae bacterium]|nr:histidinol-phosphatase HisJ family protein [Peptococcaceae bacterium]
MIHDYHIHTSRCGHARGEIQEYIDRARRMGLLEIGISDHVPMYWLPPDRRDPGLAMDGAHFPGYVREVLEMSEKHSDIGIRLGVEVDYIPGFEEEAAAALSGHPFDYVIGSVHYIGGWAFDSPKYLEEYGRRDIGEVYRDYFNLVSRAAGSGLFDIIAHPDLVKKFGFRPEGDLAGFYRQAARSFAEAGVCVEVNTAGLRWPAGEIYPSLEFLKICRMEGVPAVAGSDAHLPEQVGWAFDQARELLLAAGYTEVALFRGRRRRMVKIL